MIVQLQCDVLYNGGEIVAIEADELNFLEKLVFGFGLKEFDPRREALIPDRTKLI